MSAKFNLWLPTSATPAYFCRICKAEFLENERFQWEHHVIKCGEAHHDDFEAIREPQRKWEAEVDPEWGDYNRKLKAQGLDPEVQYGRKKSVKRLLES